MRIGKPSLQNRQFRPLPVGEAKTILSALFGTIPVASTTSSGIDSDRFPKHVFFAVTRACPSGSSRRSHFPLAKKFRGWSCDGAIEALVCAGRSYILIQDEDLRVRIVLRGIARLQSVVMQQVAEQ